MQIGKSTRPTPSPGSCSGPWPSSPSPAWSSLALRASTTSAGWLQHPGGYRCLVGSGPRNRAFANTFDRRPHAYFVTASPRRRRAAAEPRHHVSQQKRYFEGCSTWARPPYKGSSGLGRVSSVRPSWSLLVRVPGARPGGYRLRVPAPGPAARPRRRRDGGGAGRRRSTNDEPFRLVGVDDFPPARPGALVAAALPRRPARLTRAHRAGCDGLVGPLVACHRSSWTWSVAVCPSCWTPTTSRRDIMATLARTDHRLLHRLRWRWEAAKDGPRRAVAVRASAATLATSDGDADVFRSWGHRASRSCQRGRHRRRRLRPTREHP